MNNLIQYFTIKNLGIILIGLISFTILTIIILLIRMLYLKRKLKLNLRELKDLNHLTLKRRNLTGYKPFTISLNKALISQLNLHCQRKKITKSLYLETLLAESLNKGGKCNV